MTEEQLKTFLLAELKPFVDKVFWDSDGMWASGKTVYISHITSMMFLLLNQVCISQNSLVMMEQLLMREEYCIGVPGLKN